MVAPEQYHQIIKNILTYYLKIPQKYKQRKRLFHSPSDYTYLKFRLIINEDSGSYLVIVYGNNIPKINGNKTLSEPIKDCVVHLEVNREVIKVYQDKLEDSITTQLIEAGIPEEKIVILHPDKRECVQYLVNFKKIYDRHRDYFTTESNYKNPVLKPNLTAAELAELSKLDLAPIARAIARHPNTPPNLLKKLFADFTREVLINPSMNLLLLENPQLLEQLFDLKPDLFKYSNFKLPNYFLDWAVNNERQDIRGRIAGSAQISISYLKQLINDSSCLVIKSLSSNSQIPPEIHEELNKRLEKICQNQKGYSACRDFCHQIFGWDEIPF